MASSNQEYHVAYSVFHPWNRRTVLCGILLSGLVPLVSGCVKSFEAIGKSGESDDKDRYGIRTVGEVTSVGNADPLPLGGVGLVTDLEGTGGESANDGNRAVLEDDLKKLGVKNIKELLSSPNNTLVLVSARIPPGARKGDPVDVEVSLPPRSKATSLKGGILQNCVLYNYDFAQNLVPDYQGNRGALRGHPIAKANGALLVGFGDPKTGDVSYRQASLWGGGKIQIDLPLTLVMNPDQQLARVSSQVADRINEAFPGSTPGNPGNGPANAKNNQVVVLKVPPQYKHNLPRYLRIVRLIPLNMNGNSQTEYFRKLEIDLIDPRRTLVAALRLEALGKESIPVLKKALDSSNSLVKFASAEALAYLGSPSCADELAKVIRDIPMLRAYSFTALASLDEAVCQIKLSELLASDLDDEGRYGAFRSLRALDEKNALVAGEHLGDAFWMHIVAPDTIPLVHVATSRRPEVVLFGKSPSLKAPFSLLAGEFTITGGEGEDRCMVSRIPSSGGAPQRRSCSLALADILRTMAHLGAGYPEALELIQQADNCHSVSCRVRRDALPQTVTVQELARIGKQGKADDLSASDLQKTGSELGALPDLFASPSRKPKASVSSSSEADGS
ncbi:MAG: flagellar basal body P-ring protein FlgI [Planctomycetota bacterium]